MILNKNDKNIFKILKFKIKNKISQTKHASVYLTTSNKILKISLIYNSYRNCRYFLNNSIDKLLKINNPSLIKINSYGTFIYDNQEYYYCVMNRLHKNLTYSKTSELSKFYYMKYHKFQKEKIKLSDKELKFITNLRDLRIKNKLEYLDWHEGNFMKDKLGNIKAIDLESIFYKR